MAPLNPYLAYKRDTSRLIYWIVTTSNAIIDSSSPLPEDVPKIPNTTGQVTVSGLVTLSKLIAKHINLVPPAILGLFDAVIQARMTAYKTFQRALAKKPDPEMERSNASHKYFINALTEAFEALEGPAWAERNKSKPAEPTTNNQDDLEQVLFANNFAALNIDEVASDEGSDLEPQQTQAYERPQQKRSTSKGKKRKSGKRAKKEKQQQPTSKTPTLDGMPVESYRIIQDEEGIATDYLLAVYALVQEWAELRGHLQGVWRDVAYKRLNSAVAGAVSNIAIKMIERSAAAMSVYFPGHDSYEIVMDTITRGDPDKVQGIFKVTLHLVNPDQTNPEEIRDIEVDVKEQFLIYAYRDLVDFITDFQQNRSGKPTKRMLRKIGNWDPNFDLQRASEAERLNWRRCYTINWLYDLVNIYSSIVMQHNTTQGEHYELESVDWSTAGPWDKHRRLFGLNEFTGVVTHLAMQKPDSDIRQKILPHHVFQLQCIVDSLTISRGWSVSSIYGHVIEAPPKGFRSRRDVDLFLDREDKRFGSGFLQAVNYFKKLMEMGGTPHGDRLHHDTDFDFLETVQQDFLNWLGESNYVRGLTNIPPSRFSATDSNGLWEYSPFLCGIGLVEGLLEAYRYSLIALDRLGEPIPLVHLHNMLVQKGYITEPVGLYESLGHLFTKSFFLNGKVPTSKFNDAFLARITPSSSHRLKARRTPVDLKALSTNRFFKTKSYLMLCEAAGWIPDQIPESDIPMPSCLGIYRVGQTGCIVDPVTGQRRLKDTELVNCAKDKGISEEEIITWVTSFPGRNDAGFIETSAALDGTTTTGPHKQGEKQKVSSRNLLALLQTDIFNDVCGHTRLSSLNYVWVMARFMGQFYHIEEALRKLQNPSYTQAYESQLVRREHKRFRLTYIALHQQDEQCLRAMAHEFQNPRAEFTDHIYWDDLNIPKTGETIPQYMPSRSSLKHCVIM